MPRIQRRWILLVALVIMLGGATILVVRSRSRAVRYATAVVDRGDILDTVGATGTLQAVTTVQVGSQVSGSIDSLSADFNSRVRKGQVIARLDPSLFQARLGQASANLTAARANADRARATVADTRQKLTRAKELLSQQLLPETDLETAQANYDSAAAQLKASNAAVVQAEASVNQAEVDLNHTVITAPIDGVVIARNFDVGQTVAASFQAPTLFIIANDLAQMQVNASIDEADIGRVREGQQVTFRVDAFPDRTFAGRLDQVRLQPVTAQNVVTYSAIVSADNSKSLLMPGMTATVSIIVAQRENALRVPASALRFRPEAASAGSGRSAAHVPAAAAGPGQERSGGDRAARVRREGHGGQRPAAAAGPSDPPNQDATRRKGHLYALDGDGRPAKRDVVLGISDGQYVELCEGFAEGEMVVTGIATGATATGSRPTSATPNNPFAPPRPERRTR
jgi:HlyD family secretion protein